MTAITMPILLSYSSGERVGAVEAYIDPMRCPADTGKLRRSGSSDAMPRNDPARTGAPVQEYLEPNP